MTSRRSGTPVGGRSRPVLTLLVAVLALAVVGMHTASPAAPAVLAGHGPAMTGQAAGPAPGVQLHTADGAEHGPAGVHLGGLCLAVVAALAALIAWLLLQRARRAPAPDRWPGPAPPVRAGPPAPTRPPDLHRLCVCRT